MNLREKKNRLMQFLLGIYNNISLTKFNNDATFRNQFGEYEDFKSAFNDYLINTFPHYGEKEIKDLLLKAKKIENPREFFITAINTMPYPKASYNISFDNRIIVSNLTLLQAVDFVKRNDSYYEYKLEVVDSKTGEVKKYNKTKAVEKIEAIEEVIGDTGTEEIINNNSDSSEENNSDSGEEIISNSGEENTSDSEEEIIEEYNEDNFYEEEISTDSGEENIDEYNEEN